MSARPRGLGGAGREGAEGQARREPDLGDAGGDRRAAALYRGGPRGARAPREPAGAAALHPRAAGDDVCRAAVDDPAVRRLLDGGESQRLLPQGAGGGAAGGERRLRPRHPPRLRQRPRAGDRRRGQGRGGDRLGRGHEDPLRRHPARQGQRVDDDERGGDPGAGELHRRRRGAGGARGPRSRGRSRTTSSRSSWSATPTSIRPSPRMRIVSDIIAYTARGDAEVQLDLDLRLPHAGGGREPGAGARLHAGRRQGVREGGDRQRAWTWTPSPGGCQLLLRRSA